MKKKPAVVLFLVGIAFLSGTFLRLSMGCRTRLIREPVDFAKAKCLPGHEPIVIDGKLTTEGEWAGAVTVPFMKKGKASFLWDGKGIYGLLDGPYPPTGAPDEYLCVSFSSINNEERRTVRLYVATVRSGPSDGVELAKATVGRGLSAPSLDHELYRFAAPKLISARAFPPWKAEFFLSWKAFGTEEARPDKLWIHVFRIIGERPYSVLKME